MTANYIRACHLFENTSYPIKALRFLYKINKYYRDSISNYLLEKQNEKQEGTSDK